MSTAKIQTVFQGKGDYRWSGAGDVVTIGTCTLIRGDCGDIIPGLRGIDACVTDPPYGVELGVKNNQTRDKSHLHKKGYRSYRDTYEAFVRDIVPRLNTALDIATCAAVFTGPHIHEQRKPIAIGGVFHPSAVGRTPWGSKNLLPVLFYGNPPGAGRHRPTMLRSTARAESSTFPCPKPLEWMKWLVMLASRPGQTILDPFAGSFTTGVAALQCERSFIGIELDPYDWEQGCRRIELAYAELKSGFESVSREVLA